MSTMQEFDVMNGPLDGKILIEASAGTGKTFTLALLVIRMVLDKKLLISQVVAVTFTNAATGELKERVGRFFTQAREYLSEIVPESEIDNAPLIAYLRKFKATSELTKEALTLIDQAILFIDEAAIFTIHGFCQRLLTDYAFEIGAEFGKEMITDERDLVEEIYRNFWRREILTLPKEQYQLVLQQVKCPEELHAAINSSLAYGVVTIVGISEKPDFEKVHQEFQRIIKQLSPEWKSSLVEIQETFLQSYDTGALNKTTYSKKFIKEWVTQISEVMQGNSTDVAYLLKLATSQIKVKAKCEKPVHTFFDLVDTHLENLKQAVQEINQLEEQLYAWIQTRYLAVLKEELQTAKEKRNLASFNDQIATVYQAIQDDNLRRDSFISLVQQRLKVALVDEFQDTDAQQFAIFDALFGNRSLFMIGDPKQAIYRFRGGDVYAYLHAKEQGTQAYTISTNYRSEARLIAGLNELFQAPGENPFITNGIPYQEISSGSSRTPLLVDDKEVAPIVVWENQTHVSGSRSKANPMTRGDLKNQINGKVVLEIQNLLSGRAQIDGKDVAAKDIAILVSGHHEASVLKELLLEAHLPAVTVKSGNIYHSDEASFMQHLLEAVGQPQESSLLRSLLFHPLFNLAVDDVERLLLAKMAAFVGYRDTWLEQGFIAMVEELFTNEGLYTQLVHKQFEGYRPLTNFRHLFELLHSYEQEEGINPTGLAHRLYKEMQKGGTEEHEQRVESDESAIQIMTIHASKGLEFPVVFVPYAWSLSYTNDQSSGMKKVVHPLYHSEGGINFDLTPRADTTMAIREIEEEKQRLFYVALTRASQRLYLSTAPIYSKGDTLDEMQPLYRFLKPLHEKGCSALTWINLGDVRLKGLANHSARTEVGVACEFSGKVLKGDQTKSYSSIMDHPELKIREKDPLSPAGIFAFAKGARTGNAWHRIFELIDYTLPESYPSGTERALKEFGFDYNDGDTKEVIDEMVQNVMSTSFNQHAGSPFSLSMIPKSDYETELEFLLKSDCVSPTKIREIIKKHETIEVSVKETDFSGYLTGFIDLLCEFEGKYFVIDWKSNHLGNSPSRYDKEALTMAMADNEYRLQYIIYTVALVALLKRQIPDFSYEKHIGGAYYVFLRGVVTDDTTGLFYACPSEAMIEELLQHFLESEA